MAKKEKRREETVTIARKYKLTMAITHIPARGLCSRSRLGLLFSRLPCLFTLKKERKEKWWACVRKQTNEEGRTHLLLSKSTCAVLASFLL